MLLTMQACALVTVTSTNFEILLDRLWTVPKTKCAVQQPKIHISPRDGDADPPSKLSFPEKMIAVESWGFATATWTQYLGVPLRSLWQ